MGKLVRDRIPELFGGKSHLLNPDDFCAALRTKLGEEVAEYLESGEVLELADVLEVVYALAELDGVDRNELEDLRARKAQECGGFAARLWWELPST
ncbi:nucleoside triphosphate pyrophosphohydrolase [Deinococcus marmoris]|uniref:nucleoside triphosphate pyrophosphohydrolase n=1 Tax=Deinococcus marmoris TaxID=249408 RepID=UPI00049741EF|nr:nucleoside triphosphate pyrophosphohydrolase [Deinococcus marmoris]